MNLAILSGKGGTGKTTVSTNLIKIMAANYIDCDVEEPNGFIFLKPEVYTTAKVQVDYPVVDESKCTLCGKCIDVCQFNALAKTTESIFVFDKLCHSCRACGLVCDEEALTFGRREVGIIEEGKLDGLICKRGLLDIGEPMAVPVIKELLKNLPQGLNLLDCSPGTSCNVVNTIKYAEGAILVTEPNAFGLHDLKLAVGMMRIFNKPFGVIINKYIPDSALEKYLLGEDIKILGRIPYSRKIAEIYSSGESLVNIEEYSKVFKEIAEEVREVFLP